ncbi:MAG: hypothetical protein ACR2NT_08380 [Acidimicrobiia bacterium]
MTAHKGTGASYRQVALLIDIDFGYWRRLTMGERCPSRDVAERIIAVLELDNDLATELRDAYVDSGDGWRTKELEARS